MHPDTEDQLDSIDAAFFSGDSFHNEADLEKVEYYLGRWSREVDSIKEMLADPERLGDEGVELLEKYPKRRFPDACMGRGVRVLSADGVIYTGSVISSSPNSFRISSDKKAPMSYYRNSGEAYASADRVVEVVYPHQCSMCQTSYGQGLIDCNTCNRRLR